MAMDLTTYSGLQAAIADYLNRGDLSAQIPGFIVLCEAKIKRRVRRKTVRTEYDIDDEETNLPSDCAELRSIYPLTGSPSADSPLKIGTPEMVAEARQRHFGASGRPVQGAVVDGALIVAPCPDQTYTYQITYYRALIPLSSTVASNDVLAEAPDIYLYGALAEAAPFLQHDERIPVWQSLFDASISELDTVRQREELNASLKPARLPMVF